MCAALIWCCNLEFRHDHRFADALSQTRSNGAEGTPPPVNRLVLPQQARAKSAPDSASRACASTGSAGPAAGISNNPRRRMMKSGAQRGASTKFPWLMPPYFQAPAQASPGLSLMAASSTWPEETRRTSFTKEPMPAYWSPTTEKTGKVGFGEFVVAGSCKTKPRNKSGRNDAAMRAVAAIAMA